MTKSKITKLTVAALAAACVVAATAIAAPIPVAFYQFETTADTDAFSKGFGAKCKKKLVAGSGAKQTDDGGKKKTPAAGTTGQMGLIVGPGTNHCSYRSSVVGDSADVAPDQEVVATGTVSRSTPEALQAKAFVAVNVRSSEEAGYELRVLPGAQKWQLVRDPAGSGGAAVARAGKGKFIKLIGKPNTISLRAFDFGTTDSQVIGIINGKSVVTLTDSAQDQPDGRRNGVTAGAKGTAAGAGISGLFDDVAIRVPNPYE